MVLQLTVCSCCVSSMLFFLIQSTPSQPHTLHSQPPLNRTHPFDQKISGSAGNWISEVCMYCHVRCTCSISKCMIFCVHSRRIHNDGSQCKPEKSHDLRAGYVHVHAHFFVMYMIVQKNELDYLLFKKKKYKNVQSHTL